MSERSHHTITISYTKKEYDNLLKSLHLLECLENAGVDNWVGWDIASTEHQRVYPD